MCFAQWGAPPGPIHPAIEMLAAVVKEPGHVSVETAPNPPIGDYDALVRISACSICNGTDTKLIDGKFPGINTYPFILGHESVGHVVETGPRVRKYKKGDWVLRPAAVYPEGFKNAVASFWGGFAELGIVTDYATQHEEKPQSRPLSGAYEMQQTIPGEVDPVKATIYITLKETLSWLRRVGLEPGQSVLVMGSGPVGLAFATFAKMLGAHPVIMSGRRDERLALSYGFGVDHTVNIRREGLADRVRELTQGKGVNLAIDAVGSHDLLREGARALADGGKVGTYGIPPGDAESASHLQLDLNGSPQNWTLQFASPDEPSTHLEVIDLVKHGSLKVEKFITHVHELAQIEKGIDAVRSGQALKVVVKLE